jgi:hypothetical protein
MKHIKPYKIFESVSHNFPTTREEVVKVCEYYKIENYTINDDLSIDVDGSIGLYNKNLEHLPLKFNYVDGSFECQGNKLKSLEGCPKTVGGGFYCLDNELKTLEGCPQTVGGDFYCGHNKLKTLEDSPQTVDGNFYCGDNELTDLEHFPEVNGIIDIEENKVNLLVYTFIKNADSFMIEDFNDYEIVRNRDTVMLDRLKTFIEGFDLEMPDLEEIKKEYKIIE